MAYRMAGEQMCLRGDRAADVVREYVTSFVRANHPNGRVVTMPDGSKQTFPQLVPAAKFRATKDRMNSSALIEQGNELAARVDAKRTELLSRGRHASANELIHLALTPTEAEQYGACIYASVSDYLAWRARLIDEFK